MLSDVEPARDRILRARYTTACPQKEGGREGRGEGALVEMCCAAQQKSKARRLTPSSPLKPVRVRILQERLTARINPTAGAFLLSQELLFSCQR